MYWGSARRLGTHGMDDRRSAAERLAGAVLTRGVAELLERARLHITYYEHGMWKRSQLAYNVLWASCSSEQQVGRRMFLQVIIWTIGFLSTTLDHIFIQNPLIVGLLYLSMNGCSQTVLILLEGLQQERGDQPSLVVGWFGANL